MIYGRCIYFRDIIVKMSLVKQLLSAAYEMVFDSLYRCLQYFYT